MNTTVLRDGDRVWLEGVRGWSWRERRSSVHAAHESVLRAAGESVSYAYLVGVSGLAFRMQLSRGGFCPSSPHPFCGYQCVAGSAAALPWKVRLFRAKPEAANAVAETRRAVIESIERGMPAQYGAEEDGVIAGYQKGGDEWLCFHPRWKAGSELFVETEWPWGVGVYTDRKAEPADRRALTVEALQQAVRMAALPEVGGYLLGFRAWDEYIARAESAEAGGEAMAGNAWIYACLAEHRACAAAYLAEVRSELDGRAANRLERAADLYARMAREVLTDDRHDAEAVVTAGRREQLPRLHAALKLEREALGAVEEALD